MTARQFRVDGEEMQKSQLEALRDERFKGLWGRVLPI